MNPIEIGILGAGNIGQAFARHLVKAGHRVLLANRRGPASLKALVGELGPNARASTAHEVARLKIVLVAIPWTELPAAMSELSPWDGRIVIDANNHILGFDGKQFQLADLRGRTSSELFSEMAPGARVVKALNTLASAVLAQEPRVGSGRRVIFISGDDAVAKKTVGDLLESVGFSPIDLGTLAVGGRLQQAGAPLAVINLVRMS
ncbi:MAG TPA: NADPH-dependent F420 reductase [Opitutaceae bacterium]|jgi:predicted dinucleotide-binding enzyme|nr:NADPH-dependent F420 reductase [Opitutaceae bacterium]